MWYAERLKKHDSALDEASYVAIKDTKEKATVSDSMDDKAEWYQKAAQTVIDGDETAALDLARQALDAGMDPVDLIDNGFSTGIREMGKRFEHGKVFLPGLIVASEAMIAAVKVLEAAMPEKRQENKLATIVLGTVEGDIHDIGKGILATMLRVNGFEVHDLGRDVPAELFVEKAKELNADVIGSSALMTTTQEGQKLIEKVLKEAGMRESIKTMVGGAVVTSRWAKRIGADLYGESASDTVALLKNLLSV